MNPEQSNPQEVYVVKLPYNEDLEFNTLYYTECAFTKLEHAVKWAKFQRGRGMVLGPLRLHDKDITPPETIEEEQKKAKQRALEKLTKEEIKLLGL
jgi:hypothetical protein